MTNSEAVDRYKAKQEIKELKYQYCWAIDNAAVEEFVNLFTKDATFYGKEYSNDEPHIQLSGRDEIRDWISTSPRILRENVELHQHRPHNPVIQINDQSASGKWYFTSISVYKDRSTEAGLGIYENTYSKVDGEWKYSSLRGERLHTFKLPSDMGVE